MVFDSKYQLLLRAVAGVLGMVLACHRHLNMNRTDLPCQGCSSQNETYVGTDVT